jgi:cysteine desulfurase / selenocysteine lyase
MSQAEHAHNIALDYDVEKIRADFPLLSTTAHGKPLVYLDNANTTQKPRKVIDALMEYYTTYNSNIHRASYQIAERSTHEFEMGREKVRKFLNANCIEEVIFVRNATEGINLVAQSYGRTNIGAGDEIIVSAMEHHANIVPWQMLCEEKGAILKVIPVNDVGELLLEEYEKLLSDRTKLVGIVHMSNALGTVNPVEEIIRLAHAKGVPVLVDGAQSAYHKVIDVQKMDCDFFVFSGHKLYGPTGIGVLYGKRELLEAMPPWMGGGDMIASVSFEKTIYNALPNKFEAGTPHIVGSIGLGAAIDYLTEIGMDKIAAYEHELMEYGKQVLSEVPGLRMIGTAKEKASVFSFVLKGIHALDMGTLLDTQGICIRTGQHCAHPVMKRFGVEATGRASLACYNTRQEIDALARGLVRVSEILG